MRSLVEGTELSNNLLMEMNRFGILKLTLAAAYLIPANSPPVLVLDPGGAARNVDLPANPRLGQWYLIFNDADAAEIITLRDSAGAGFTPPITPTQSEAAFVIWDGAKWRGFVAIQV